MMTRDPLHVYLESLAPPAEKWMQRAHGTKQVTDAYLLALAEQHDATFVTFDTKLKALAGSRARTEVLAG
jgi:predicted nucleic acid-binding protein